MKELMEALSKFQSECPQIIKDKVNPFHKSKYADLDSIWNAIKKPLKDNGLVVYHQSVPIDTETFGVETYVQHIATGQHIKSMLPSKAIEPQKVGSVITYYRRYEICLLLGIVADDDDDANATVKHTAQPTTQTTTKTEAKPVEQVKEFLESNVIGKVTEYKEAKTSTGKDVTYITVNGISYSRWGIPSNPVKVGDEVEVLGIVKKQFNGKTYYNAGSIIKVVKAGEISEADINALFPDELPEIGGK